MTEKILPQDQKKNLNIKNHHNLEVNPEKFLKLSFHNLKY